MTPRCQVCGTFENENTTVIPGHDVCYDCVDMLVENEVERRGERRDQDALKEAGRITAPFTDRERQQLIDAGRGHLT